MPRIDAHQHFWKLERGDYGWLTEDMGPLYRDYLPEDFCAHSQGPWNSRNGARPGRADRRRN
ncbi:hypothetical protein QW131_27020 [Roseibium salinum]|nr:hypothetical protein [Roseibium salinum]